MSNQYEIGGSFLCVFVTRHREDPPDQLSDGISDFDGDSLASFAHQDEIDQQSSAIVQQKFMEFESLLYNDNVEPFSSTPSTTDESSEWRKRFLSCALLKLCSFFFSSSI